MVDLWNFYSGFSFMWLIMDHSNLASCETVYWYRTYTCQKILNGIFIICSAVREMPFHWLGWCSNNVPWLVFWNVHSLNLNCDTGFPEEGILWFTSPPLGKCWDSILNRLWPLPSRFSPIHLSSYHSMLYSLSAGTVVK